MDQKERETIDAQVALLQNRVFQEISLEGISDLPEEDYAQLGFALAYSRRGSSDPDGMAEAMMQIADSACLSALRNASAGEKRAAEEAEARNEKAGKGTLLFEVMRQAVQNALLLLSSAVARGKVSPERLAAYVEEIESMGGDADVR